MNIGYIRVSSILQNTERQLDGIHLDKKFIDKASGKDKQRPALIELIDYAREGDIVLVHSMDRLARDLADLISIVKTLTSKKVKVNFIKENLTCSGDDSPFSILIMSLLGAVGQFERARIKENQAEGIAIAQRNGVYKRRVRKKKLSEEQIKIVKEEVLRGVPKSKIARKLNICRSSLYVYLNKNKDTI